MLKLTARQEQNFWDKVLVAPGSCHEWLAATSNDYGVFTIFRVLYYAHRISFLLKYGYLPEFVLHTCDNPSCVNPEHLYDGTHSDNMIDRSQRGFVQGHKLTPNDILEVRKLLALGQLTNKEIGERVNVTEGIISNIKTGRIWNHV